jgi:hypothetical protein
MAGFKDHEQLTLVKGLVLGDAGAGKTSSLISLIEAGYELRIYDFDNLLAVLRKIVIEKCPERLDQVKFQTFTDKMKGISNPLMMVGNSMKVMPFVNGTPKAFSDALKQLEHWKDGDEDLGDPASWGDNTVVVIDTLTSMSAAAFRYVQAMNPGAKEPQSYYFAAQQLVINMINLLCSKDFKTNVLVLAHVNYDKDQHDLTKGFPRSIGSALNDQIATYFNSALLVETQGNGASAKRTIRHGSTGIIDLKNPAPFSGLPDRLPVETGLADFFKAVKS